MTRPVGVMDVPRKCCGPECSCLIVGGAHIAVDGSGSSQDPYVISGDFDFEADDNITFDLTLTGVGSTADPYVLTVDYAATAKLAQLPDVSDAAPTNGQVLAWNTSTGLWTPVAPTTAAAGSVSHDTSLSGDGSAGSPLQVAEDPNRLLATSAPGLGLSDLGMNSVIRHFTNATARNSASPAPILNALSMLDTAPGRIDYWNGTEWLEYITSINVEQIGTEFLALSGSYAGIGAKAITKNLADTTDAGGGITILSSADLAGYAGVLSVQVQPTGANAWEAVLSPSGGQVLATAYRIDNGAIYPSQALSGLVTAVVY